MVLFEVRRTVGIARKTGRGTETVSEIGKGIETETEIGRETGIGREKETEIEKEKEIGTKTEKGTGETETGVAIEIVTQSVMLVSTVYAKTTALSLHVFGKKSVPIILFQVAAVEAIIGNQR